MKIFDSHFHIIDSQYPLHSNQGFVPAEFSCDTYLQKAEKIGIVGGAVVSGSFQGFDQTGLLAALRKLGPAFAGVAQLPFETADDELLRLDRAGVRAARFNLRRGVHGDPAGLEHFAKRIYEKVGWHVEIYADSQQLADFYTVLTQLPVTVIDHLGLSSAGFPVLLKLVEQGTYVKASGFGRLDMDPAAAIRKLTAVNPDGVIFGTDLPSTRAPRPFQEQDIQLVTQVLDTHTASKVLYTNGVSLYKPGNKLPESDRFGDN